MIHAFVTHPSFVKDHRWIVMDGVPIGFFGMTDIVSCKRTFYFFILALQNVADHVIAPTVRSSKIQKHIFYGAVLLSQVHGPGTFQHETRNIIKTSEISDLPTLAIQGALSDLLAGGERGVGAVFIINAPMDWNFGDLVDTAALPQIRLRIFKVC